MIQVDRVRKVYGHFAALRDVSFTIPQGQIVALLGPNGAGKTTLMRILAGFLAPTAGAARVAGIDVGARRLEAAARLGYLPENGPLYPDMTVASLLRFFAAARGLTGDRLAARTADVVERCELQRILETPTGKLSKGLRQRVGVAQALLHDPDVLIMDEPTAGLDPNQIRRFREHLQQLRGAKTVLMSTHILAEVTATADRVILINEGVVAFDGAPADMLERGSLEEPFYRLTQPAC